jgi:hypothetical protein
MQWRHTIMNSDKIQYLTIKPRIMATNFWDRKGSLLVNFLPRGDTVSSAAYCEMLKKLLQSVQNKQRGMLTRGVCVLHDNACLHTARATQELLQSLKLEILAPPPQRPDLAPSDYHLFSKLKESLAGKTIRTMMRLKTR